MFALIRASFNQRRKTMMNSLSNGLAGICKKNFSKEQLQNALTEAGLSLTIRGEALTLEQFANLSNILSRL